MWNEKPIVKLYSYEDSQFNFFAIVDDYEEISFERSLYEAGQFTIQINKNIPNASKFKKGLFIWIGNDPLQFGEIFNISDAIDSSGKVSQKKVITGFDARYLYHRRIIKKLNAVETWTLIAKGETCMRRLIQDQCGSLAESKRRLPIGNVFPDEPIGLDCSVSEAFTNLYDTLVTIATQTRIGWGVSFNGSEMNLEIFQGEEKNIIFSPDSGSLESGEFVDTYEEYCNAVYVGGKGSGIDRDIYEAEISSQRYFLKINNNDYLLLSNDGSRLLVGSDFTSVEGLDRFEFWDDQNNLVNENEYKAEAEAVLSQYANTISVSGTPTTKSPYIYGKDYNVGDSITIKIEDKYTLALILAVSEHWAKGTYDIEFTLGKPINFLKRQMSLILKKIQGANSNISSKTTSSIMWYHIPVDIEMKEDETAYDVIGFYGDVGNNGENFKLYYNENGTGVKTYHVYIKELEGSGKLRLYTDAGYSLYLDSGTYVTIIYVDEDGKIISVV